MFCPVWERNRKNGKVKFLNNTAHPETQVTLFLLNNITSFILSDAGFNG